MRNDHSDDKFLEADDVCWILLRTIQELELIKTNPYFMFTYNEMDAFLVRMVVLAEGHDKYNDEI